LRIAKKEKKKAKLFNFPTLSRAKSSEYDDKSKKTTKTVWWKRNKAEKEEDKSESESSGDSRRNSGPIPEEPKEKVDYQSASSPAMIPSVSESLGLRTRSRSRSGSNPNKRELSEALEGEIVTRDRSNSIPNWIMAAEEKEQFRQDFATHDTDGDGYIVGMLFTFIKLF
jgi:hypothetical protein